MDSIPPLTIDGLPYTPTTIIGEWQSIVIGCSLSEDPFRVSLSIGDRDLGPPMRRLNEQSWSRNWSAEGAVGRFPAIFKVNHQIWHWSLSVESTRIHRDHYRCLLDDIQTTALSLVVALGGGTVAATSGILQTPSSLLSRWSQLEALSVAVTATVADITRAPHTVHQSVIERRPIAEITSLDHTALATLPAEPLDDIAEDLVPLLQQALRPPQRRFGGPIPRSMRQVRRVSSADCQEHRILVALIRRLTTAVATAGTVIDAEYSRRLAVGDDAAAIASMQVSQRRLARQLRKLAALPFLEGIVAAAACSTPTHLMLHDRRYRSIFEQWRALHSMPVLACDVSTFYLPLTNLSTLYERWCLLQVATCLARIGTVRRQALFASAAGDRLPWTIRFAEHQPLLIVELPNQTVATLYYHRRFRADDGHCAGWGSLDPYMRIPDIVVELERPRHPKRLIVFDAKYRVDQHGCLPEGAMDTAYTYLGAIGYQNQQAVTCAWLLFPGTKTWHAGDVGALALLPGATEDLAAVMAAALTTVRPYQSQPVNHS
ncbi:MAG: hypothetical protein NVS2B7_13740 [Herpetosiphon sp.]